MAISSSTELIQRYLQDAIAAEKSFESQLRSMAEEGDDPNVQQLFAQHADETRSQYERLTARLEALGGSHSSMKSMWAHIFGMAPKGAQLGQQEEDKNTQNLIIAYAVEHSECAMYEALKTCCETVGDHQTAALAQAIQREERATADKIWSHLSPTSISSVNRQLRQMSESGRPWGRGEETRPGL
jgi:ferritin-like metal-binding protein YciE